MVRSVLFCASTLAALSAAQSIEKTQSGIGNNDCSALGMGYDAESARCVGGIFVDLPLGKLPNCEDLEGPSQDKGPCMLVVRHGARPPPVATTLLTADDHIGLVGALGAAEGFSFLVPPRLQDLVQYAASPTETSINFLLHNKIDLTTEHLSGREPRISERIINFLKRDPELFFLTAGHSYVSGISKGGSYFATINLAESRAATSDSMDVWANIANPFGASGNAEYQEFYDNGGSRNYNGGSVYSYYGNHSQPFYSPGDNTQLVLDNYDMWRDSLTEDTAGPQDVFLTPWIELLQVRQIVEEYHPDKLFLFMPTISPGTFRQFTECRGYLERAEASAATALDWGCLQGSLTEELLEVRARVETIRTQARGFKSGLAQLQENDLRDLEATGSVSEYFSRGKELLEEFQEIYQGPLLARCRA